VIGGVGTSLTANFETSLPLVLGTEPFDARLNDSFSHRLSYHALVGFGCPTFGLTDTGLFEGNFGANALDVIPFDWTALQIRGLIAFQLATAESQSEFYEARNAVTSDGGSFTL